MKTTATFLLAAFLANPENKQTFVQFNSQEEFDRILGIIKAEKLDQFETESPLLKRIPSFPLYVGFGLGFGTNLPSLIDGKVVPSEILVANEPQPWQDPIENWLRSQDCPKNQVLKSIEVTPDLLESLLIDALGLNPQDVEKSLLLVINEQRKEIESQSDIIKQRKKDSEVFMERVELLMELRKLKKQA